MVNSWKEKQNKIWFLIKKISDHYGGEEQEFLRKYFKDLINEHKDNLDIPLAALLDLEKGCK